MAITKTTASKKKASTSSSVTKSKAAFTPIDATKKPTTILSVTSPKDGQKRIGKRARTVTKWSKEEVQFVLESIIKYHDKRQNRYKITLFTTIASMFEPKFNIPVEGDQLATIFKSVKKSYNHFIKLRTSPQLIYDAEKTSIIVPLEVFNSGVKQGLRLLSHIAANQIEDHVEITFPYFEIMQEILKTNDFTNNNDKNDKNNDNNNTINEDNNTQKESSVLQPVNDGQINVIDEEDGSRNDSTSFASISGSDHHFDEETVAALQPTLNHHHHQHHHHHHNQLNLSANVYKDQFSDGVDSFQRAHTHLQPHMQQITQQASQHVHLQPNYQNNLQQQPVLPPLSVSEENKEFRRKVLQLIDLWNIERKAHTDTIASLQNTIDLTNKAVVALDYKLDKVLEYLKRTS